MYNPQLENLACNFAKKKHESQIDDNGLCYFESHIVQVVNLVRIVTSDSEVVAAAYLHDTIEDTDTSHDELVEKFGKRVTELVMEVTHDGAQDHIGYYFPRLHSQFGIMIKFADRLSNISRMEAWPEDKRKHYMKKSKFWRSSKQLNG